MAKNVLDWAKSQPKWVGDSLRRLATSANYSISEVDFALILQGVRHSASVGLSVEGCECITQKHLGDLAIKTQRVVLTQIGPIENIDRLATNQVLRFAPTGITLVYGENGSGKSGYTRIAKNLCRSISVDQLRGNVFNKHQEKPIKVKLKYKIDENEIIAHEWAPHQDAPNVLRQISVFDTYNARLYVDNQNKIAYLPAEIAILEHHGQLCQRLNQIFDDEDKAICVRLETVLPAGYTPNTKVSISLESLKYSNLNLPTERELQDLSYLNESEQAELASLERDLIQDPVALAAARRRSILVLNRINDIIVLLDEKLSTTFEEKLNLLREEFNTNSVAAQISASLQFANEPLQNVGSEAWRVLYEAACAYVAMNASEDVERIPEVQGIPCPLCQEPLSSVSVDRISRFNAFVHSDASRRANQSKTLIGSIRDEIDKLTIPASNLVRENLASYSQLSASREIFLNEIVETLESFEIRKKSVQGNDVVLKACPDTNLIRQRLLIEVQALALEAQRLEDGANHASVIDAKRVRLADLKDRTKLGHDISVVLQRRNDLITLAGVRRCKDQVNTRAVSFQISALRKVLITDELDQRIRSEIKALDLEHIPLQSRNSSVGGQSLFSVKLEGVDKIKSNQVLSEGEQRALALACFLAEAGDDSANYGLIIDDPVSSLDHLRVRRVAKRLVAEAAKGRQVVIFTHSIVFFNEVVSECAKSTDNVLLIKSIIRKTANEGFGVIVEDCEPWIADLNERVNGLRARIKIHKSSEFSSEDTYRRIVKDLYSDLRECWERAVEELVLAKTVVRFVPDVMTQSLKGVCVTDDDYKTIFFAMKRVSERSGHDMSAGRNIPQPNLVEIEADVKVLEDFRLEYKTRAKLTVARRKALEEPLKAKFLD